MATYNGAQYIREQLESIIGQTYTDWQLLIRDDKSSDGTVDLIKDFASRDSRIKLIENGDKYGSAVINFSNLFDYVVSENKSYIMFADQDDIWNEAKVSKSLSFITGLEEKYGKEMPLMAYSSFQYIDQQGKEINQELIMPSHQSLVGLLTENYAYGCTMILNPSLVQIIKHIPDTAENHDYWIALVASTFGKSIHNPEKLLKYRQHDNNVSGNVSNRKFSSRIFRYVREIDYLLPLMVRNYKMINLFYYKYNPVMESDAASLVGGYLKAYKSGSMQFFSYMLKNKIKKQGVYQSLAYYYTIYRLRKSVLREV